jgi:opacity protein-like surface antigen
MKNIKLLTIICLLINLQVFAQVFSDKVVGKKNIAEIDSLKTTEYPYSLPIWGAKATKKGYKLPYSAGLSINYFTQRSDLILENLSVGFNNGPMYNIDEIVRFNSAVSEVSALSIRPDIWLFPFLNVYAILGKSSSSTLVDASIWIPDAEDNWTEIMSFNTKADFNATTFGIGMTPTIGVGGGWIALDMNFAWTDVSALDKPVFTSVFGPRFGKTFKLKKPESNINVWAGGFRVEFSSDTNGSLNLNEVVEIDGLQVKVDNGIIKVEETQVQVNEWWNALTPIQQNNPVNIAKYNTANRVLETSGNFLATLDTALNDPNEATVQYSLDKKLKDAWNFVVGSQYQLNKNWMIRAEIGFLGSREQFMTGLQYRFGL